MRKIVTTSIFAIFLSFSFIYSSTTGKLAGVVTDQETGDPLIGVNVFLEGTILGSATDLDGYFFILNVPPGSYQLNAEYLGYRSVIINNVVVKIDLTTEINFGMEEESIEVEPVVVEAKRPIVVKDVSNSQMNIEAQSIQGLPVQRLESVLTLHAGIERGKQGIIVRGGSPDQTVFMLDGFSLNDERSNIPWTVMSITAIEEVKVQTGGFNAEYGDMRSGLVNVVTKEGSRNQYNGSVIFNISPITQKHFGPSLYDPNSYFNRPFMDPAVCWTGTANGAWDENMRKQYPNFEGWIAVSENTLQDNDPNNDLTPVGARQLFEWQRRREGDISEPDYVMDASLGGPIPFLGNRLGNLRFHLNHYREQNMLVFPLSQDSYSENQTQLKLTSDISPTLKLLISGMYGEVGSVSPYDWKTTPTGRVLKSVEDVADLANDAEILYIPGYYSPSEIYRSMFGVKLTHILNQKLYYDVNIQYKRSKYNTYETTLRDTSRIYQPVSGYFVDEAPFGYWGYSSSGIDGMDLGGWMNLGRDQSLNSTFTFNFDLISQFNSKNEIKSGLKVVYNDYKIDSGTESPSMSTWNRSMIYSVFPFRIGAYVQDKLEIEGFIANLGLRLDYSDANSPYYQLDTYDKYFGAGYGQALEEEVPSTESKADWYLSPRLGVSHPITVNSKLFFNYGHFLSEPGSSYRFRIQRESNGLVTFIGNRNLEMQRTIAYELGYEQNLWDMFLLKLAAYYKDVSNQPGWISYQNINQTVQYEISDNNNYEDIRGFEITLTKRVGQWISGFLNYTYDVRTSGYFGLEEYYEDPKLMNEYLRENPYQEKPRPQPYARANIMFKTPVDFGPKVLGLDLFSNWILNILGTWRSGRFYTYNPFNIPGVTANFQFQDSLFVDLRITKSFNINRIGIQLYADIFNLFNTKYFSFAGFSDQYDRIAYLESLRMPWETGDQKGDDRIGDRRPAGVPLDPLEPNPDNDPAIAARNKNRIDRKSYIDMPNIEALTFLNPRDIFFGIKITF
jgi:outer membrane receptor protein involved in Fe transport